MAGPCRQATKINSGVPQWRLAHARSASSAYPSALQSASGVLHAEGERLYDHSEGNPLFVVEALRADPGTAFAPGARAGPKVQAVIAARLAQLFEPAADLVGVAAVIGREFTTEVLADASGQGRGQRPGRRA